jgi:hypothetical protein
MTAWEIPVPFSREEVERLSTLAVAEGTSVAEYVRPRVFGPTADVGPVGSASSPAPAVLASDQERLDFYDRLLDALMAMRIRMIGSAKG